MPLWLGLDTNANSAPKHGTLVAGSNASAAALYGNVAVANVQGTQNMSVALYGADITETQFSNSSVTPSKGFHAGWILARQGTGPVATFSVTAPGSNYANLAAVKVSNGVSNAVGVVTTNASGNITSVAVFDGGRGFINVSTVVVTSNASNSLVTAVVASGGTGFLTGDQVAFSNGLINGVGVVTANSSGNATAVTITNGGAGFSGTNAHVVSTIGASGRGAGLTFTGFTYGSATANGATIAVAALAGRAGRVHYETIVASGMANTANGSGAIPGIGI